VHVTCRPLEPIVVRPAELGADGRLLFAAGFLVQPKDPADFQRVYDLLESDAT
jgi:hypothetical protein